MISTNTETLHKLLGKKIFSIVYTTQSGRTIKRRERFGVMKGCKNPPKINKSCINYFDLEKQDFRNANLHDIQLIKQGDLILKDNEFELEDLEEQCYILETHQKITKQYRVKATSEAEAIEKFGRLNHLQWKSVDHGREDLVHCEVDQ